MIMGVRNIGEVKRKLKLLRLTPTQMRRIEIEELDLASFRSVREFAERVFLAPRRPLHCLINNAHLSGLSKMHRTVDDIEYSYQVNYLSHFLLTRLLEPSLESSSLIDTSVPSNVINVGSRMYRFGKLRRSSYNLRERNLTTYDPSTVYADTKLMQLMFTMTLAKRYNDKKLNITATYVHPGGLVRTAGGWVRGPEYSFMHRLEPLLMKLAGRNT